MTDDVVPINKELYPLHRGNGRAIMPTGFHHRPASTIREFYARPNFPEQLDYFEQWISGSDTEASGFRRIDGERLIRWTLDQEGSGFTGLALLRSAQGAW